MMLLMTFQVMLRRGSLGFPTRFGLHGFASSGLPSQVFVPLSSVLAKNEV